MQVARCCGKYVKKHLLDKNVTFFYTLLNLFTKSIAFK